jgi:hypothetical protein
MKKFVTLLIFSVVLLACGPKQQKQAPADPIKKDSVKVAPANEYGMWKIAYYASNLGDSRDKAYITNSYAIWGTFSNNANDKAELKAKFMVDKETFCIKLLEYGTKAVKKGNENLYKIKVKTSTNEVFEFTAKNVSDRLFIKGTDSQRIIELFNKGGLISFYMVTDSKTDPATYSFTIDNPDGFEKALLKISK